MLKGRVVSPHVAPPFGLNPTAMPCAPPFDQRSCWKGAMMLLVSAGFTLPKGSSSALSKFVPDCPALEQLEYGLGPEITTTELARAEFEKPRTAPPTSATAAITLFMGSLLAIGSPIL